MNTETAVAHLIGRNPPLVMALATELGQARLWMGNDGGFFPDDLTRPARYNWFRDFRLIDESQKALPYLASVYFWRYFASPG